MELLFIFLIIVLLILNIYINKKEPFILYKYDINGYTDLLENVKNIKYTIGGISKLVIKTSW